MDLIVKALEAVDALEALAIQETYLELTDADVSAWYAQVDAMLGVA